MKMEICENSSQICRICLSSDNDSIPIFLTRNEDNIRISEMISICTGIEMSKYDNLANLVCHNCLFDIKNFYKFRQNCWKSNKFLLNNIGSHINEYNQFSVPDASTNMIIDEIGNASESSVHNSFNDSTTDWETTSKFVDEPSKILKTEYTNLEQYICHICEDQFKDVIELQDHAKSRHNFTLNAINTENVYETEFAILKDDLELEENETTKFDSDTPDETNVSMHFYIEKNKSTFNSILKKRCYCNKCDNYFENLYFFEKHLKNQHKVEFDESALVHKCPICAKYLGNSDSLRKHIYRNHSLRYTCIYCNSKFNENAEMNVHIRDVHKVNQTDNAPSIIDSAEENRRVCYACGEKFSNLKFLKAHFMKMHEEEFDEAKMKHECGFCNKEFGNFYTLCGHIKMMHSLKNICKLCGLTLTSKQKLVEHTHYDHLEVNIDESISYDRSQFIGQAVTKIFTENKKTAEKVMRRKCYICGEKFPNIDHLKTHITTIHNAKFDREKILNKCDICEEVCINYREMIKHILKKHPHKHICDYCGSTFTTSGMLVAHIRRHTGEKPFKCDECEYKSTDRNGLLLHKRSHSNEQCYECSICPKKFKTASARAKHHRTHLEDRPFTCTICSKSFKFNNLLKEHMLIHYTDKYISCEFCGKKFPSKKNLRTHVKTHTGDRSHICDECGKGFIQRHCWRTHMKNHHDRIVI